MSEFAWSGYKVWDWERAMWVDAPKPCDWDDEVNARTTGGDEIDKPSHYRQGPIECYDAIASAAHGWPSWAAPALGNVMKYTWRCFQKGKALRDLRKAHWYLERAIADMMAKGYEEE